MRNRFDYVPCVPGLPPGARLAGAALRALALSQHVRHRHSILRSALGISGRLRRQPYWPMSVWLVCVIGARIAQSTQVGRSNMALMEVRAECSDP